MADMERLATITASAVKGITDPLLGRLVALEVRVAALETKAIAGPQYCGVHEAGKHYDPCVLVTRAGGLWLSTCETTQTPGQGPHWRLIVKKGEA
jgi:hypothetical protein